MEFHEAANIFPMDEENIGTLAEDIKANGLQVPIETFEGKILDGRRRFRACKLAKVIPIFRVVNPDDPVAYVLSLNLHRRHLTPSQVAMIGGRARECKAKLAKERQKRKPKDFVPVNLPEQKGDTRDQVGKMVGVSGSLIDAATKVLEKGIPELAKAVDEGRLSVTSAAKIADEPEEIQEEIAEKAKFSGGRYRKPEIKSKTPEHQPEQEERKVLGVGVDRANEAINCLIRIPKNDALRKRGFQIVMDWIKHNSK